MQFLPLIVCRCLTQGFHSCYLDLDKLFIFLNVTHKPPHIASKVPIPVSSFFRHPPFFLLPVPPCLPHPPPPRHSLQFRDDLFFSPFTYAMRLQAEEPGVHAQKMEERSEHS